MKISYFVLKAQYGEESEVGIGDQAGQVLAGNPHVSEGVVWPGQLGVVNVFLHGMYTTKNT